jgi:hypothetical protein
MLTDEEVNGLVPGDLLWFGSLLVIVAEGVHEIDNDTGYGRQIIRVIAPGEPEACLPTAAVRNCCSLDGPEKPR